MANDLLTLALGGDVPLPIFATAIERFSQLVQALSAEISPEAIEWIIDDLQAGSALATVKGESDDQDKVARVVSAYGSVGKALEAGRAIPYSDRIARAALSITGILNGKVTSVRFETEEEDATIFSASIAVTHLKPMLAYGAVEGKVQTLSNRGTLRFIAYDRLFDRAVSCYLDRERQELMRNAWGHVAIIEGMITRDPLSGRPVLVRDITNVTIVDERKGDYTAARGAVPFVTGMPLPEDAIRRLRDA